MNPTYFDTHAHTQFSAYDEDRDEVIKRAFDAGVWIINIGSNTETSKKAIALAEKYEEGIYAVIGIHPSHADMTDNRQLHEDGGFDPFDEESFVAMAKSDKVVAVGECGLEYSEEGTEDKEKQRELFLNHIEFCHKIRKPIVIHCRNAYRHTYEILKAERNSLPDIPGVMHFFAGSKEDAYRFLDLGFGFSFGGVATFAKKGIGPYDEVIKAIPDSSIMLETDAPFVSPEPLRGKRNEPVNVIHVAKYISVLKGVPLEVLAKKTTENAFRFFAIPRPTN